VPESAAHYGALFLGTALPPVSRMASEIGDKDVCGGLGCLAVPEAVDTIRLHPTKPWPYLSTVSLF
jgi:hypothetical protein